MKNILKVWATGFLSLMVCALILGAVGYFIDLEVGLAGLDVERVMIWVFTLFIITWLVYNEYKPVNKAVNELRKVA